MVTKVHKPIEAKANEKTVSESNLIRSSRQDQLKINSYFRKAHQKIRSEVEDIEHRLKVNLPEFQSYKRTLLQGSEPDYCYILEVWIEIVPYAMFGEFGVTHTRKVQTIREPFLARTGSDVEANGVLGLTQQELENLASWSAGRRNSLMNPAPHSVIPSQVQALAWYCRLLALREFLQRLDLRMEKQSEMKAVKSKNKLRQPPSPRGRVHAKEEKDRKPFRIGNQVHSLISRCRDGLTRFRKSKANHPSAKHIWKSELLQEGFKDNDVEVLMTSKTPESAACRIVAQKHGDMKPKTVQNYYSRFKDSNFPTSRTS